MSWLFVIAFAVVTLTAGDAAGCCSGAAWWTHLTYCFPHGNVAHLAADSVALVCLSSSLRRRHPGICLEAYAAAVAASFIVVYGRTLVGSSGMSYYMAGCLAADLWTLDKTRRREAYVFTLSVAVMTAVSALSPSSALALHCVCLAAGIVSSLVTTACRA